MDKRTKIEYQERQMRRQYQAVVYMAILAIGLAIDPSSPLAQTKREPGPITGWLSVEPRGTTFEGCRSKGNAVALWPPNAAKSLMAQAKRERKLYSVGSTQFVYATINLSFIDAKKGHLCRRDFHEIHMCATPLAQFTLHRKVDMRTCEAS